MPDNSASRSALAAAVAAAAVAAVLFAAPPPGAAKHTDGNHEVPKTTLSVRIDGVLDDAAWQNALTLQLPYETSPQENVPAPARTELLMTYDSRKLYAAFRAYDPQPELIRAHYSDRDQAFQDDFVGIVVDTFNDERRAYEFFVNPLGVQMDLLMDDVGGNEDSSWDTIWDSAGRLTEDGYVVELAVPFDSLRFPKCDRDDCDQTWGLDALRIYPRDQRRRLGLNKQDRNRNCYLCQATKVSGFTQITPGRNFELDPTVTATRTRARFDLDDDDLGDADNDGDAGLTVRWGLTPSLTLNGTLNPDFSQVEADAAQLDVNTQFALFFREKRPFFLESADLFDTWFDAVFTRTIADPDWGVKLTGKEGKHAIGVMAARDTRNNLLLPGSQGSQQTSLDDDVTTTVVRYRRDVGESSALGVLLTDREGSDYHNRLVGVDGVLRPSKKDSVRFQYLHTDTRYPDEVAAEFDQPDGSFGGDAFVLAYNRSSRDQWWSARYVDKGEDFRADAGFESRVDTRFYLLGHGREWWAEDDDSWWSWAGLGGDLDFTEQHDGQPLEREAEFWFNLNGPWQSSFGVGAGLRDRFFNGAMFAEDFEWFNVNVRPNSTLRAGLFMRFGNDIDFANTRSGEQLIFEPSVTLRLGRHLSLDLEHVYRNLEVEGGERLFTANLTQAEAIYQFNQRLFVRAITQFRDVDRDPTLYLDEVDSESQRLFNQFLFSYKLNPQTVLFLGYSDNHRGDQDASLTQTDRTVFFKVGYAWRL